MIKAILAEVKDRIGRGYKGELLFNYRTGNYEIITWLEGAEHLEQKTHKLPSTCNSLMLKKIVYPGEFT